MKTRKSVFKTKLKDRIFSPYSDRYTKMIYVFNKYQPILTGKVLDVGGDQGHLRSFINDYTNIDRSNTADIKLDLEKSKIPFNDNTFDCVLCLDVLEHLDNIHDVFDDLCRVTKKWLIVSLPNCKPFSIRPWRKLPRHYGLGVEKPEDRHKWYFYFYETIRFVKHKAKINNMEIIQMDCDRRRLKKYTLWAAMKKIN